ncbi:MAG: winged helix-turn-helix domain-containing protein [Promethearchaeota archaeon]
MESNFYYALGHDLRRRIIKIIGDNEFSSFTTLKKELKVSTGTIYHHLDALSQLIEQRKDKKYYLTELGQHAYDSLQDSIETITDFSKKEFNSPILKILMFLTPKKIINYEKGYKIYAVIFSIGLLILGLIFCNLTDLFPTLLFFTNLFQSFQNTNIGLQIFFNIFFIINFLLYYFINELICRIVYKKNENSIKFLLSFSLIFYPTIIYLTIHYIFKELDLLNYSVISIMDNILMIIFQVWALWLLTYNLIVNKHLRLESALIISLLIHYGGFSIILALSI